MSDPNKEDKKLAVEKYLDQVKILTALATALLVSPNLVLILRNNNSQSITALAMFEEAKIYLLIANVSFLVAIGMTYFIYSSVVGFINDGIYDVYRPATRVFSIIQLLGIIVGCITLVIFFCKIV